MTSSFSRPQATALDRELDLVTLINTFTVTPENQQAFVDVQHGEYRRLSGQIRGAVAANLHRGRSGTRVINYAQFRSLEDFQAWQTSDLMKQHRPVIARYVERVSPGLFRLVHVAGRDRDAARITMGGVAVIAVMAVDPDALDGVLAAQRATAEELVRSVPGARALALHRGLTPPRPGAGPGAGAAAGVALYAVVEDEAAAVALMEHAGYRASFTTERTHIRAVDVDVYTTVAVE
jgi:heme-degrading monooxygenase HmoA